MKHLYSIIIVIAGLVISSCSAKQVKVTSFDVNVSKVLSTKATVVIEPSNPDAYYCYGIINRDMDLYFNMTDLQNAQFQLNFSIEMWERSGKESSFASRYCYKGKQTVDYTYLTPDMDYRVIIYQVNPETRELAGTPTSISFHTNPLAKSNISFNIEFDADKVTITPSNNDDYCWDYIESDELEAEYADATQYFTDLILMYEEYGFMDLPGAIDRGKVDWVFSVDDFEPVNEGEEYTLVAAGYSNGEINSDLTVIKFIYHKDKPCELVQDKN